MTSEKVQEVINIYRKFFQDCGVGKIEYLHDEMLDIPRSGLEHCHSMLDQMEIFLKEGRLEKAFRWLGFIQGCLWFNGNYVLADLKDHNRP